MNKIEEIRKEISKFFDSQNKIEGSERVSISPNHKYRLESEEFKQTKKDVNWSVAKIILYDNQNGRRLREFYVNDNNYFQQWIEKNGKDYLICPEDIYGGHTIVDLTENSIESYSAGEDGFIGTKFYISPDKDKIGIIGCVWACPYELRIYDFFNPMKLPFKQIDRINLDKYKLEYFRWIDNNTVCLRDNKNKEVKISTTHNKR